MKLILIGLLIYNLGVIFGIALGNILREWKLADHAYDDVEENNSDI